VAVSSGDLAGAVERCLDGLRVTELSDHLLPRLYLLPCLAVLRLIQGDFNEALRLAEVTNDLVDEWCPTHPTPVTRALVAYAGQLRGDTSAVPNADTAASQLGASGAQLAIADLAAWMVAMVWEQSGRHEDARGLMRLIWDLIGAATGALVMAPDLVRTHMGTDRTFAQEVIATLTARAERAPGDRTELVRRRASAIFHQDPTELVAVADRYDEIGSALTAAWSRFDAVRAASNGRADASTFEALLRSAIGAFDRFDASAVTAQLRAVGRTEGIALRPTRTKRSSELTETERRVAELAGQGRSNREIGSALYMSGRTAEAHLGRVFAKLGVKNRVELAALLSK
jgi:DNA-binding CsgD family transcriptional regulator